MVINKFVSTFVSLKSADLIGVLKVFCLDVLVCKDVLLRICLYQPQWFFFKDSYTLVPLLALDRQPLRGETRYN